MAITAQVTNGLLDYNYTDNSKEAKQKESMGSNLGYDQFLQLLCAEMQYQDPLEPTSNTDYVAQLATFSQLEATLSMQSTAQNSMANDLVGKQVILAVPNEATGNTSTVSGAVDYVMYQNGKAYLSVNDALYLIDYLDTVADSDYYEANAIAKSINNMVSQLPDKQNITSNYKGAVEDVRELYDGLTDYQKTFVSDEDLKTLRELEERLKELEQSQSTEKTDDSTQDQTEETEETEG